MNDQRAGFRRVGSLLAAAGVLAAVIAAVLLIGDFRDMRSAWDSVDWHVLAWLPLLAALNHLLRYTRWQILLRRMSSVAFRRSTAFLIFSAGSLLIFTPARIGEVAKSVYARDFFGIPVATSLPILIAERIADVVVMAVLGGLGLLMLGESLSLSIFGIVAAAVIAMVVLRMRILAWAAGLRLPNFLARRGLAEILHEVDSAQVSILSARNLCPNFLIGVSAWTTEVAIYFLTLVALGFTADSHLFLIALAAFSLASLGGSLSLLPGGLGVTEGALTALPLLLGDYTEESLLLAALLTRASILGTVVIAGFVSLALLRRAPLSD